ncbi:MAG: DUF6506 family protein [Candidatus Freyarchaeum deiterrae]
MAFKALFLAHAPDAEPKKNRCVIETGKYKLFVVVVRSQEQALEECKNHVKKEGIHAIILCPGFTNKNIAEIQETVGEKVGVNVAGGDSPSNQIAMEVMQKEGWFPQK